MTDYAAIALAAQAAALDVMGGVHEDGGTIILLGPSQGFWPLLKKAPEWLDGAVDPVDRWSRRVIGKLAAALEAEPLFPFGGPPYLPFFALGHGVRPRMAEPRGDAGA